MFLVAGGAKLADLPGSRRAVAGFGAPERLAHIAGVGVPLCELAAAVALFPTGSARYGALGALGLLVVFMVGIAVAMVRGREADCHCFGQLHSAPVGWRTLARNGGLAAVAAFVVVEGWRSPGVSATGWVARVSMGWLVAGGAGVVVAALVGFQVWFSLQLLSQNGRTLGRLEALEATISELRGYPALAGRWRRRPARSALGCRAADFLWDRARRRSHWARQMANSVRCMNCSRPGGRFCFSSPILAAAPARR